MAVNKALPLAAAGVLALAAAALLSAGAKDEASAPPPDQRLGLFSSLPVYWAGGEDIPAILDNTAGPGWVRQSLERRGTIVPLDALEDANLAGIGQLVLAQPRPLAPSENVALDNWVRGGGALLLFADPMLTHHSDYALGDKRRPQDTVLLSPILARWGLVLMFDEGQVPGERAVDGIPVNLAGHFALRPDGEDARCTLAHAGLVARCTIGRGRVTLVADAALLEGAADGAPDPASRSAVLDGLLAESFAN